MTDLNIPYTRYLDPEGQVTNELPAFAQDQSKLIELYRRMTFARRYDGKLTAMQRTGRIPSYAPELGEEAVRIGYASAMEKEDVLLGTYRDTAAMIVRGVTIVEDLMFWGGDERGNVYAGPSEDFPLATPIATQTTHAVGVAYAFKLRGEKRVAVTTIGDGGSSKGDFYEAMNFAGAWQVPVVFIIINNQWAISMPRERQSAAETLAQKGLAAGIPGEQVDGNDVIAVHDVISQALEKARSGGGPSVVEIITYRLTDHSTADDASRYRDSDEVSTHWKNEPLIRLRTYLSESQAWTKEDEENLLTTIDQEIEDGIAKYEAQEGLPPEAMFDHMYAELPMDLKEQREAVMVEFSNSEENGHG
jgi:2-oxoisovalerate dehydrogenase E1 component alpha subunit